MKWYSLHNENYAIRLIERYKVIKMKKNNCYLYIKTSVKNGKKYENLYAFVTLNDGREVGFQVKQAFFNRKFASLLGLNLPKEDKDNGK